MFTLFEPFWDAVSVRIFDRAIDARAHPQAVASALEIPFEKLIFANQTHSKHVFSLPIGADLPALPLDDVDAFVTNRSDVFLMIRTADCQAIVLFDPVAHVIGAVHSGWRGSVQNIVGETIAVMQRDFGCKPEHILAGISPAIGPCCQVFTDPASELPAAFHQYIQPDNHVNFWRVTLDQLLEVGVPHEQIEFADICTMDDTEHYFSYRVEGAETGRFASVIGLRTV